MSTTFFNHSGCDVTPKQAWGDNLWPLLTITATRNLSICSKIRNRNVWKHQLTKCFYCMFKNKFCLGEHKRHKKCFDLFNLTQSVTGPSHDKEHTLDLVLSYGFCITIREICDMGISDHLPVLFTVVVHKSEISTYASARSVRAINPLTASQFSSVSKDSLLYNLDDCDLSVEEFTVLFDCICTEILDSVALLRKKHPKGVPVFFLLRLLAKIEF